MIFTTLNQHRPPKCKDPLVLAAILAMTVPSIAAAQGDDEQAPLLEPVEVETPPQADRLESITVLDQDELNNTRFMILNDALFFGIPGTASGRRTNLGAFNPSGGFVIRGLGRSRASTFVDGIPSQTTNHFHPITSMYTPDMIDRVEVVRSPTGVSDGPNAMASLQIFTPPVPREGFDGYFSGNGGTRDTSFVNGRAGHGWGSGGFWIGATRNETDGIRGMGQDQINVNLKAAQDLGAGWTGSLRLQKNDDKLDGSRSVQAFENQGPNFSETCFCTNSSVLTFDRSTMNASSTVSIYQNQTRFVTTRRPDGSLASETRQEENEQGVRLKQAWSELLFPGNNLTVGLDGARFTIHSPAHQDFTYWSPYVETSQETELLGGKGTVFSAGLRFTDSSDFESDVSPQLGMVHHLDGTTAVRVNLTKAYQIPRAAEIAASPNRDGSFQTGNDNLDPTELYSQEIGLNKTFRLFDRSGNFDIVGFAQQADEAFRSVLVDDGGDPTNASTNVTQVQNVGDFDHQGVELTLEYQVLPQLTLSLAETYLSLEAPTVPGGAGGEGSVTPQPEQIFDFKLDYQEGPYRLVWQTRWAQQIFIRGRDGSPNARLDDYTVSNVKLAYALHRNLAVSVNVENVSDEEFTTFRPGFRQPERLYFLGFRYEPNI